MAKRFSISQPNSFGIWKNAPSDFFAHLSILSCIDVWNNQTRILPLIHSSSDEWVLLFSICEVPLIFLRGNSKLVRALSFLSPCLALLCCANFSSLLQLSIFLSCYRLIWALLVAAKKSLMTVQSWCKSSQGLQSRLRALCSISFSQSFRLLFDCFNLVIRFSCYDPLMSSAFSSAVRFVRTVFDLATSILLGFHNDVYCVRFSLVFVLHFLMNDRCSLYSWNSLLC